MTKTIEEAMHKAWQQYKNGDDSTLPSENFIKGFNAGLDFALTHQWRSVEDELPSDDTLVIAHSPNGRVEVLRYQDGVFRDELQQAHYVDYWMELPSLNPEQR